MERAILWSWLRQVPYSPGTITPALGLLVTPPTKWLVASDHKTVRGAIAGGVGPGRAARTWPVWGDAELSVTDRRQLYLELHKLMKPQAVVACLIWPRSGRPVPQEEFEQAGYTRVATMESLTGLVDVPTPERETRLVFRRDADGATDRFCALYEETLTGSLDCVGWHDPRSVSEILASMGGTRQNRAFVRVSRHGSDIGCLVLSHDGLQDHADLEYLGLVSTARGERLGESLLGHARSIARQWGCRTLGVRVDSANLPALRLYTRGHFYTWTDYTLFAAIL